MEQRAAPKVMTLQSAAVLMVFATLGSRVTGMVRTMVLAHCFGTAAETSAFYQAFTIPDLVYFLIAGGALRSGFVPVISEYLAAGDTDKVWRTFSSVFWLLLFVGGALVAGGMIFAPALALLVVPGWSDQPELVAACGQMMRVLFPAQLFFMLGGGLFMGMLNAQREFFWPGIGPIVYNLFIIAGAVVGHSYLGVQMVAYFVVIGAVVGNFALQIPPLMARGARLHWRIDLRDEGMWRVLRLAAPIILGLAVSEINWVLVKVLATYAGGHAPAILENANRFWKLPSGIFGAGIAIALLPTLSSHYATGDQKRYSRDFSFGLRNAMFLTVPAAVVMAVLRAPVVRLLFEHGQFTASDTAQVATVLLWLTPAMVALSVVYIVARAFYARQDTVTPVLVGLATIGVCALTGIALVRPLGLVGLAIATSAANLFNAALLLVVLQRRVADLDGWRILDSLLRLAPACVAMGLAMWGASLGVERLVGVEGLGPRAVGLLGPLGSGIAAFVAVAVAVRCEELRSAWRLLRGRGSALPRGDNS